MRLAAVRPASPAPVLLFFFFNDTATTEIYTLSLHDALPISWRSVSTSPSSTVAGGQGQRPGPDLGRHVHAGRSEEHTSELQSRLHLVCRLLLEKKQHSIRTTRALPATAAGATPFCLLPGPRL